MAGEVEAAMPIINGRPDIGFILAALAGEPEDDPLAELARLIGGSNHPLAAASDTEVTDEHFDREFAELDRLRRNSQISQSHQGNASAPDDFLGSYVPRRCLDSFSFKSGG